MRIVSEFYNDIHYILQKKNCRVILQIRFLRNTLKTAKYNLFQMTMLYPPLENMVIKRTQKLYCFSRTANFISCYYSYFAYWMVPWWTGPSEYFLIEKFLKHHCNNSWRKEERWWNTKSEKGDALTIFAINLENY